MKILRNFIDSFENLVMFYLKNAKSPSRRDLNVVRKLKKDRREVWYWAFKENLIKACCYHKSVAWEVSKYLLTITSESSGHSIVVAFYFCKQINGILGKKNTVTTIKQSHSLEQWNGSSVSLKIYIYIAFKIRIKKVQLMTLKYISLWERSDRWDWWYNEEPFVLSSEIRKK